MRQRMISVVAAAGLLTAVIAGPALAGAGGIQRYQVATTSYTIVVEGAFIHTFVVAVNPCDDSIAITGSTPLLGGYYTTETVTGTLAAGVISFSATYDGPYSPGFMWTGSFPVAGGALSGPYSGTVTAAPTTLSTYKNHGDFVSSMGGGPEAAHSCIGMPISKDDALAVSDLAAADQANDHDVAAVQARLAANEARLLDTLKAVLARLKNPHATSAIQKHIDAIEGGDSGLHHAAQVVGGDHSDHPKHSGKPASAGSSQDHPNHGNHSGKP